MGLKTSIRAVWFGPKVDQILAQRSPSQSVLKSDLKSPGFVSFGANLTNFETKYDFSAVKDIRRSEVNESIVLHNEMKQSIFFTVRMYGYKCL